MSLFVISARNSSSTSPPLPPFLIRCPNFSQKSSKYALSDARPPVSAGVMENPARLLLEAFASLLGWSVTLRSYVLGPLRRGIAS